MNIFEVKRFSVNIAGQYEFQKVSQEKMNYSTYRQINCNYSQHFSQYFKVGDLYSSIDSQRPINLSNIPVIQVIVCWLQERRTGDKLSGALQEVHHLLIHTAAVPETRKRENLLYKVGC